jgi:hypothetical protein
MLNTPKNEPSTSEETWRGSCISRWANLIGSIGRKTSEDMFEGGCISKNVKTPSKTTTDERSQLSKTKETMSKTSQEEEKQNFPEAKP